MWLDLVGGELHQVESMWGRTRWGRTRHGAKPATTFCIIKRNAVNSLHNTLNSIDQHISFTIEEENNNQIAFLDASITREDDVSIFKVYRKPISNIVKRKSFTLRTNPIPLPEELVCMFFKWAAPSDSSNYTVISYITGISQPLIITRLFRKHDIRVVSKPLRHYNRSFPLLSLDLRLIFNQTWFTKYLVPTAHGVM